MAESFTILTVCTGNIHRSALADELLATWVRWYLPAELQDAVVVGSAGTGAPVGAPMGSRTRAMAQRLGAVDRGHRARALTDRMIDDADLVLAASRGHREEILKRVPRAMRRTFTIREAARIADLLPAGAPASTAELAAVVARMAELRPDAPANQMSDDDVKDPQGKGAAGVAEMVRDEIPALARLAVPLLGMPDGDAVEYIRFASDPESLD